MFKNSNEFFDEISNTDRLQKRNDYFVFSEYEIAFYTTLIDYLDKYEDNTQDVFITNEISMFKTSLAIIEFIQDEGKSENEIVNSLLSGNGNDENFNEELLLRFKNMFFKHKTKDEYRTIEETKASIEKIILFLEQKKINQFTKVEIITLKKDLSKYENKTPLELTKNTKHENIFCNNGFELFEYLLKEYVRPVNTKGRQSDLIFYYWKMYNNKPQFIHQRPTEFFTWFDKEYSETSGQLKTYDNVKTTPKEKCFSLALDWFKPQNH